MSNIYRYEEREHYRGSKKYKKKKKTKKSDHRHDYEKVIGITEFMGKEEAVPHYICRICGKTDIREIYFSERVSEYLTRMVTDIEEVKAMFPELRVVRIENRW